MKTKAQKTIYRCIFNGRAIGTRRDLHRIIECVQAESREDAEKTINRRYECVHYFRALPLTMARRIETLISKN